MHKAGYRRRLGARSGCMGVNQKPTRTTLLREDQPRSPHALRLGAHHENDLTSWFASLYDPPAVRASRRDAPAGTFLASTGPALLKMVSSLAPDANTEMPRQDQRARPTPAQRFRSSMPCTPSVRNTAVTISRIRSDIDGCMVCCARVGSRRAAPQHVARAATSSSDSGAGAAADHGVGSPDPRSSP